jgi:hypothetical protein
MDLFFASLTTLYELKRGVRAVFTAVVTNFLWNFRAES